MTQDEIMEMARQVGYPIQHPEWQKATEEFAALMEEKVAAKERETAIKIIKTTPFSNWFQADVIEAIRARGEQA
jgi:hypothetical protein